MEIATPSKIWASWEPYDLAPSIGDIVQLYVKTGGHGFNAVWVRMTAIRTSGLEGAVVDGPAELKGKAIGFSRRNVFHVV